MPAGQGLWPGSQPLGPRIRRLMRMCDGTLPHVSFARSRECETSVEHGLPLWAGPAVGYCSRRPRPSPMWRSRFVGARAVGPWVGERKPLGKTPCGATPVDLPTYMDSGTSDCSQPQIRSDPASISHLARGTKFEKKSNSDNFMKNPSLKPFWTPLFVRMWRMLSRFRHPRHTCKRESIPPCYSR